jgi:hypothetical protein
MLFKSNSATNQRTEFDMCGLTVKVMVCACVLYYSILALCAIENSYNINDFNNMPCDDTRIVVFVIMTIVVSVGMILSYYCYRRRQTELRLAICLLFILSIFGLYGLLFSELYKSIFNQCNIVNLNENATKDIHLISWIWINLISLSVFALFIGIIGYIIYLQKYNISTEVSENTSVSEKTEVSENTSVSEKINSKTKKSNKNYLHSIFENEHEHEL